MSYVDGFLIAVKTADKEAYRAFAEKAAPIFRQNGATRVVECWGDDVPPGKLTSFALAVKAEEDEVVVFSWIEWPSKEARDTGMTRAMDAMPENMDKDMPFDGKRMIFGGFEPLIDA